ncbi:MAG: methylenetetrahydrofolate reductase, partial [Patescibacteria group bacterium]
MGLKEKLGREFVITTELGGTNGTDIAKSLGDVGSYFPIDGLNVIDCASGRLRINSPALAHLIQSEFPELDVIPHLTCRDRNILGLQADLLGAHGLGIRYILATTGDPPKEGPYKDSNAVYNVTSVQLIKMIANLNRGLDHNGEQIKGETDFFVSAVTSPGATNLAPVIKRMKQKIEAGANFFQTQPMYDVVKTKEFLSMAKDIGVPILLGIMPLRGLKMAEYMNEKVAGIDIP